MVILRVRQKFASFAEQDAAMRQAAKEALIALEAKMAAASISNDQDSQLLKLPGEIRNRIYRYAILQDQPIQLPVAWNERNGYKIVNYRPAPLTIACHKLHREVTPIYLAENNFCLTNFFTTTRFHSKHVLHLRRLLGDGAKEMKRITVARRLYNTECHPSIRSTAVLHPTTIEIEISDTKLSGKRVCCCSLMQKAAA
ncbi:hypothetical protein LTR85_003390 [Meristemomyces frigidus]|nr:hypothetical protein LTR85_003390 [Meristemomyces frigidus]